MIFDSGYGGPDDVQLIRWTPPEMMKLCDDEGLISLFIRYTTGKKEIEREALEQIAVHDMLADKDI